MFAPTIVVPVPSCTVTVMRLALPGAPGSPVIVVLGSASVGCTVQFKLQAVTTVVVPGEAGPE